MANRRGEFVGAYVPSALKRDLEKAARDETRTVSQEIKRRLAISLYGTAEIPGSNGGAKAGRPRKGRGPQRKAGKES